LQIPIVITAKFPLRINVGFIAHETSGYSREFDFDLPVLQISDDLMVTDFKGSALFSRTQKGILMEVKVAAVSPAECGRCLDEFPQTLETDFIDLFAFDERNTTDAELIYPENGMIDLAPIIADYLLLSLPINPVCRPDCAGLCPNCGANHNHETCDCSTESIDPRLSKLKDLLDKENN